MFLLLTTGLLMMFLVAVVVVVITNESKITIIEQQLDVSGYIVIGKNSKREECLTKYDPSINYFLSKYQAPNITLYGNFDLNSQQFVLHNTTNYL